MENSVAHIHSLLTSTLKIEFSKDLVNNFAKQLGWNPSYFIPSSKTENSNGYLVIEYGLQNSAIISFLNKRNEELTNFEEERLLGLSYNNLVNWHITIDDRYINYYYILNKEKSRVATKKIEFGNEADALSVNTFYEIIGKKPNPNIKPLDDVLIENISLWKRIISAELKNNISLNSLSHLFNSIIFLRSIEDFNKRRNIIHYDEKTLLSCLEDAPTLNIFDLIQNIQKKLEIVIPDYVVNLSKLKDFDELSYYEIKRFFSSFYENENNQFRYDFSIITKQALSRIYQKYVSLLNIEFNNSYQENLFGFSPYPIEIINKEVGAFYTPEYVAKFFAKYLSKKHTYSEFNNLAILDPAVGSGIFLRTILETEIERRFENDKSLDIDNLFNRVIGIDIDPNACLATNLSLTLLNYNFNYNFNKPKVINYNALALMNHAVKRDLQIDIVVSNPPYINQNKQSKDISDFLKYIMGDLSNGKIDTYHAFLKLSIDLLKPGGKGLFVIPHNFLVSQSSKNLRNYILEHCTIEIVADLSSINVFENVNTYTLLLIVKKRKQIRDDNNYEESWLLKCRSNVGEALLQLLNENEIDGEQFQIYNALNYFKKDSEWFILNKKEFHLFEKLKENKPISDFLKVTQGVITGKDEILIRPLSSVHKKDNILYKKFMPDKEIAPYNITAKAENLIFYPFIEDEIITENVLASNHVDTWHYLIENKRELKNRSKFKNNETGWWKLHSAGNPTDANSPKIISPYLSISPKFALDINGDFITARSSYFTLKEKNKDLDLLFYFLGILNSIPCYWSLSLQSHKQSSGYNIFPIKLLKTTPIPDPTNPENYSFVNQLISEVKRRIIEKDFVKCLEIERKINEISCNLYKLTKTERELLGIYGN